MRSLDPCMYCGWQLDSRYCGDCDDFSHVYPYKTPPFEHQEKDFVRFKDDPAFALFWEMGTGKTKETIDIAAYKFLRGLVDKVIIVAPNTVHEQWVKHEIPKHCGVPTNTFVYYNKHTDKYMTELLRFLSQSENKNKLHFLAVHVEAFQYPKIENTIARYAKNSKLLWVVDEGTRIKNTETQSHQSLLRLRRKHGGACTLLTGTALAKKPLDAFGMVEYVRPGYFGSSYAAFQQRHAVMMKQKVTYERKGIRRETKVDALLSEKLFWIVKSAINKMLQGSNRIDLSYTQVVELSNRYELSESNIKFIADSPVFTRFKNVEALKAQVAPMSSMRRKVDCVELPEKVYEEVQFDLEPAQKKLIKQMQDYAVALYGDRELTITQKQALQVRALQVCGGFFPYVKDVTPDDKFKYGVERMKERNAKLEYIKADLEELGGEAFIVWAVFTEELKMLHSELSKVAEVGLISGIVSMNEREAVVEDFLSGKLQGLVANPQVAGYGLNFQHAGYQYWYSRNFRTEARLQAEDRSHRIGIARSPVYKDLVYRCAFERKVLADNKEGRSMNDFFNTASVADLFTV